MSMVSESDSGVCVYNTGLNLSRGKFEYLNVFFIWKAHNLECCLFLSAAFCLFLLSARSSEVIFVSPNIITFGANSFYAVMLFVYFLQKYFYHDYYTF